MGEPQTKYQITADITPTGWSNYSIEDMARAAVWAIRKFSSTEHIRVLDSTLTHASLKVTLEISSAIPLDSLKDVPAQLKGLAEIPLAPCSCGCGVDLSVTECKRDDLEAFNKGVSPSAEERALVANGQTIEAIRKYRQRTGMPMKDAADRMAKVRQQLQVAFEAQGAELPKEGGGPIPAAQQMARELVVHPPFGMAPFGMDPGEIYKPSEQDLRDFITGRKKPR